MMAVYDVTTSQYVTALAPNNGQSGTITFTRARIMAKNEVGITRISVDNDPDAISSLGGWGARVIAIG